MPLRNINSERLGSRYRSAASRHSTATQLSSEVFVDATASHKLAEGRPNHYEMDSLNMVEKCEAAERDSRAKRDSRRPREHQPSEFQQAPFRPHLPLNSLKNHFYTASFPCAGVRRRQPQGRRHPQCPACFLLVSCLRRKGFERSREPHRGQPRVSLRQTLSLTERIRCHSLRADAAIH